MAWMKPPLVDVFVGSHPFAFHITPSHCDLPPPARVSAMMPDPTTVARRNAVPKNSAATFRKAEDTSTGFDMAVSTNNTLRRWSAS
jgi:hypothetical protein